MFRTAHIVLMLAAAVISLWAVSSCKAESPAYNRENIKATWIVDTYDGNMLDERNYTVMTFDNSGIVTYEGVLTLDSANYQWGSNDLRYEIYCCDFTITGAFSGLFGYLEEVYTEQKFDFILTEDSLMTLGVNTYSVDGTEIVPEFSQMTMRKLPRSYASADTLYGVWQFNTRNGTDFSNYRMQFQPDGVVTVSVRTGENSWEPMGAGEDYYNLYEDFIAMTLYDNYEFGTSGKWDVKCFLIDSISSVTGRMALQSGGDNYSLSFISSN